MSSKHPFWLRTAYSSGLWPEVCLRFPRPFFDLLNLRIQRARKRMEGLVFPVVNEGAHRLSIHRIELHWFSFLLPNCSNHIDQVTADDWLSEACITRACNWLTSQLSNLTTLVQFWMLPLIAFVIAALGSFLIFKMWKNDWWCNYNWLSDYLACFSVLSH